MSASVKCDFANLKYEQLLTDKYFIETCFSKKYESYPSRQMLKDMWMEIRTACPDISSHTTKCKAETVCT